MNQAINVTGQLMPAVGLGLWKLDLDEVADTVYNAIKTGYRHLDSAADYGNEKQVGEGIARAIADGLCRREDLWITSKLWNTFHRQEAHSSSGMNHQRFLQGCPKAGQLKATKGSN